MRSLAILVLMTIVCFSCARKGQPEPLICTEALTTIGEQVTMKLSDTLVLVNCSKRYTRQRWVLPNGGTSTSETVYYIPDAPGTYVVKLYVSNDKFVNEYEASRVVIVNP